MSNNKPLIVLQSQSPRFHRFLNASSAQLQSALIIISEELVRLVEMVVDPHIISVPTFEVHDRAFKTNIYISFERMKH